MKKKLSFCVLLLVLIASSFGVIYGLSRFMKVDGRIYISIEDAKAGISASIEPMFVQDDLNEFVSYRIDIPEYENSDMYHRFWQFVTLNKDYDVEISRIINYGGIGTYLEELNESGVDSENAYIARNDKGFYVVPEVVGTKVDISDFVADLNTERIDLNNYIIQPSVKMSDLAEKCNTLNNYVNWSVAYDNGIIVKAPSESIVYDKDGEIDLNLDFLNESVNTIADDYNTVGSKRNFVTSNNEKIEVKGGTWGSIVNKNDELNFLKESFQNAVSMKNRHPVFESEREDFGDTYIEVSIQEQHMWLYENGVLTSESDVVTGTKSRHDTPVGAYFISERKNGKYLTGDGYRTWVNKWMRITNQGHGLHDASWRGRFGGRIYEYDGSHGCINLPHGYAKQLYERTYWGMPVVIY